MSDINEKSNWKEVTSGGVICNAGNSREIKTGAWRSSTPVFIEEKCKQCGFCFAVCPDDAIPVGKDQKRCNFNYEYCKGCGICAKVCPFGAIEMK